MCVRGEVGGWQEIAQALDDIPRLQHPEGREFQEAPRERPAGSSGGDRDARFESEEERRGEDDEGDCPGLQRRARAEAGKEGGHDEGEDATSERFAGPDRAISHTFAGDEPFVKI